MGKNGDSMGEFCLDLNIKKLIKMKNMMYFAIILFLTLNISNYAQLPETEKTDFVLTGNLREDSKNILKTESRTNLNLHFDESQKKPFLAGVLSLILPGAGEFYSESYIKAGVFLALEAAAITTAIVYDKKGDDQTSVYQHFADRNWDVSKYAAWLWNNREALGIPNTHGINSIDEIIINNDPNLAYWERVDFSKLNLLESKFSHRLPKHGDQQYYEMIGKYPQYNHGWVDQLNDNTPQYNEILTPMFHNYSLMRGEANNFYNVASKAVIVLYVNHFLSALDAVWSAVSYNKDLTMKLRVKEELVADRFEIVPRVSFSFNF